MNKPALQKQAMPEAPAPPTNSGVPETDLRVQLATERTLLAWMRTGLALMAFGFVVARFSLVLETLGVSTAKFVSYKATIIGVVLVLLGIIVNIGAPLHYRAYFRRINAGEKTTFMAWSLIVVIAYSMAIIGVALAVYLLLVDLGLGIQAGAAQSIKSSL